MAPRTVLICPEPLRGLPQGLGIRFLAMAQELQRHGEVRLWTLNADLPQDLPCPAEPLPHEPSALAQGLSRATAVVLHGGVSRRYFALLRRARLRGAPPVVVDLCDPFFIEHFNYAALDPSLYWRDRFVLTQQLSLGDFFLVACQEQWLFYAGLLAGTGRLTPALYQRDPTLGELMQVAGFGVDPNFVLQGPGRLKGQVPGIGVDDVVLFFGGVYDWYDPLPLLAALGQLLASEPRLKLVFVRVPQGGDTTPQTALAKLEAAAAATGWLGERVVVIPWFPYAQRGAFYRDIDLAVVLHRPSLETALSFRIRLLDYLNAGVAVLTTRGGAAAALVERAGLGTVADNDPATWARALSHWLADRSALGAAAQRAQAYVRRHHRWQDALAPLVAFCQAPKVHPLKTRPPSTLYYRLRQGYSAMAHQGPKAALARAWRHWRRAP
ncbi:MAG: glycosyltransferase [Candidatus Competibacterales bacterium]